MAQGPDDFDGEHGDRAGAGEHERWSNDAPTAAWLTAHGDAVPLLPVKPSRLELAVIIALAETYGAAVSTLPRFLPVLDFIADDGAVKLVQRVMYGARPESDHCADFDVTADAAENARLAELLREARTAFEFLCASWPDAFMAQASDALEQLGLPRLRAPAPPSVNDGSGGHDQPGDECDEEGGDA